MNKSKSRSLVRTIIAVSLVTVSVPAFAGTPVGSHADAAAQFSNARHLWQSGKFKQAAALYESLIERYPQLPESYNNLAVIYAAQGDYKKAQQVLEKGLNTHPGYAAIYENLTAIYVEMARDSYGKALQLADQSQRQLKLRALAELTSKPEVPGQATQVASATEVAPVAVAQDRTPVLIDEPPAAVVTPAVKPAQPEVPPAAPALDQGAVIKTLESWAEAWSAQSPQAYLAFYAAQYHPAGKSRRQWQVERETRIKRPQWIRVTLSDFSVESISANRVRVEVKQRYQSNSYSDRERKEFILLQTEQGWRIAGERNL